MLPTHQWRRESQERGERYRNRSQGLVAFLSADPPPTPRPIIDVSDLPEVDGDSVGPVPYPNGKLLSHIRPGTLGLLVGVNGN